MPERVSKHAEMDVQRGRCVAPTDADTRVRKLSLHHAVRTKNTASAEAARVLAGNRIPYAQPCVFHRAVSVNRAMCADSVAAFLNRSAHEVLHDDDYVITLWLVILYTYGFNG